MFLTVERFRCYTAKTTFQFPTGLTLLSSPSGTGKSTIFNAISWLLFGGMRDIYPHSQKSTNANPTCVTLDLPGIKIERKKPPETLTVTVNGVAYVSDAAQSFVCQIFGSRDLWSASSYLAQGSRSSLIELSSHDKFRLLYELTFGDEKSEESPDWYTNKADIELNGVKSKIVSQTGYLNALTDVFQKAITANQLIFEEWSRCGVNLETLKTKILDLNSQLQTLQTKYMEIRDIEIRNSKAELLIASIRSQRDSLFKLSDSELNDLKAQRDMLYAAGQKFQDQTNIQRSISDLEAKRSKLGVVPDHLHLVDIKEEENRLTSIIKTWSVFDELHIQGSDYDYYLEKVTNKLNSYDEIKRVHDEWSTKMSQRRNEISQIENIRRSIKLEHEMKLKDKLLIEHKNRSLRETYINQVRSRDQLIKDHEAYDLKMKQRDLVTQELDVIQKPNMTRAEIQSRLSQLNDALKEYECPHCQGGVSVKNGILIKGHTTPDLKAQYRLEIEALHSDLGKLDIISSLNAKLLSVPNLPPEIPVINEPTYEEVPTILNLILPALPTLEPEPLKPLSLNEIQHFQTMKTKLLSVSVPPISRLVAQDQLRSLNLVPNYHEYTHQINDYKSKLANVEYDHSTYIKICNRISGHETSQQKILIFDRQLDEIKFEPVPQPSTNIKLDLDRVNSELVQTQRLIQIGSKIEELTLNRQHLTGLQDDLIRLVQYEASIVQIKRLIDETSSQAMEEIVDAINVTTNSVLETLFDDPITVRLSTHKTLKTKEVSKLQINLQIMYRNVEYKSINELSGGEATRVGIGLIIALSKANTSPIVLFDESVSCLDAQLKESTSKVLRQHLGTKVVISTCHEAVLGHYDKVITL